MPWCGFGWITQEFTPHRGGETEALKRLEDSLADTHGVGAEMGV
jgi:hypothetical protein